MNVVLRLIAINLNFVMDLPTDKFYVNYARAEKHEKRCDKHKKERVLLWFYF